MQTIQKVTVIILIVAYFVWTFDCLFIGTDEAMYNPSSERGNYPTCYSDGVHYNSIKDVMRYLRENGWVSELIDDDQLEYEILLIEQLSSTTNRVPASLAIAQVALESRFNPDAENNGAIGLMQIIPNYYQDRLSNICEEPTLDKWYEARYNIAVGLSYMDELLGDDYACGDKTYALMMYNQGPVSGTRTYLAKGIVSDYASTIITLKQELDVIMEKGDASNGETS